MTSCPSTHFKCRTSQACIPSHWQCDGDFDCGSNDNSDESESSCNFTCPINYTLCGDAITQQNDGSRQQCIPTTWICDGQRDCDNGWDEERNVGEKNCHNSKIMCKIT